MKSITTQTFETPAFDDLDDIAAIAAPSKRKAKTPNKRKAIGVKPKDSRRRFQFRFDLDVSKEGEAQIASWLNWLKERRQYKTTLLEGFRLIIDLKNDSTQQLEKLFPALVSRLIESHHNAKVDALTSELIEVKAKLAALSKEPPPPDTGDLARRVSIVEQLVLGQRSPGSQPGNVKMLTNNFGSENWFSEPKATAPAHDDDDTLVVTKDVNAGSRSAQNFIKSAFALNGMTFDS